MATIVLGMGTSHGPMLSTPPDKWDLRVPDDRNNRHHFRNRTWTFDELVQLRRGENLDQQITLEIWKARHAACRTAISKMADMFEKVKPDIAVIVGNDQMEIFNDTLIPAFSVLWGEQIINSARSEERLARLPPGVAIATPGHIPPGGATYPAVKDLGKHIIERAVLDNFDVAAMTKLPKDETPHAFGFVYRQIMNDRVVPSVPVVLNTFYPPNQPTAARCYDFGKSIAKAIESWDSDARVALIASGGMTHFVIDEEIDHAILADMREGSMEKTAGLGESIFQSGTSEIKNWIPVAGAMAELKFQMHLVDYVPCYRSEAGTGNAMGFVYWLPTA
ncbi:protocatechuate 3,4-dioxygenase [Caballeronia sordidicola]|uniref:DODA-type extradiol aromatic ring-opening family dioxygenase n=1 Tax=Caballeronia sordidicola TaxID=196367 RepID=UPI000B775CB9|nr:protocatechuate 3,4-dioxygenase [Caballeronia sordidicola]